MGTHFQGTEEQILALDAFIKLKRAVQSVQSVLQLQLSESGLTENQLGVLEALLHLGPMCQRALGEKLLSSGGNITMVVDNLEKQGLVRRERSLEDRRLVSVCLTEEGRERITRVFPAHVGLITRLFSALTSEEQAQLAVLCRQLGRSTSAAPRRQLGGSASPSSPLPKREGG